MPDSGNPEKMSFETESTSEDWDSVWNDFRVTYSNLYSMIRESPVLVESLKTAK